MNEYRMILTEFIQHFLKLKPVTVAVITVSTRVLWYQVYHTLCVWQFIADLIFVRSVQVKHLEVSCASMADDICKKSAIIETYVMDSRRGKQLSLSPSLSLFTASDVLVFWKHLMSRFTGRVIGDTDCAFILRSIKHVVVTLLCQHG